MGLVDDHDVLESLRAPSLRERGLAVEVTVPKTPVRGGPYRFPLSRRTITCSPFVSSSPLKAKPKDPWKADRRFVVGVYAQTYLLSRGVPTEQVQNGLGGPSAVAAPLATPVDQQAVEPDLDFFPEPEDRPTIAKPTATVPPRGCVGLQLQRARRSASSSHSRTDSTNVFCPRPPAKASPSRGSPRRRG